MCRAFRKPTPSHRPGFEPWCSSQQAQYFRDHQSFAARPLSITDILNETHVVLHPAEGTSFSHPFSNEQQQQFLISNQTVMDNKQLIELPQLDSPTASLSAASLAIKEQQHHNGLTNEEDCSTDERNNNSGQQGIDWKSLDSLFSSNFTDTSANYFSHNPNLPLMIPHSHDHDIQLQSQNQANHILGCFPSDS